MSEPLQRLSEILTLLGPGLWLEVDKAAFYQFFRGEIGRESAEIEAIKFAKSHNCIFKSDGNIVRFGRAYPSK